METTEHRDRARATASRHSGRRRSRERRDRRHRRDREAAGRSSSSVSRPRRDEAVRGARRRDRSAGMGDEDSMKNVPASSSPAKKKPRLRSEVGEVRGCLWRFEPFSPVDNAVDVPAVALAPTSSSSLVPPAAEEAAPAKGGAATASSSSTAAPPGTTTGLFFARQVSSVPPPPPPLSCQQAPPQAPAFTAAAPPPPVPASTSCPTMKKAVPFASTSRPAYAIPAIPQFPIPAPEQQDAADPDDLRRAKVQRYAGLIAKKQQETTENYRKLLRSGKAPPEPSKPPAVDKETLRRNAARDAARKRLREALREEERKARGAGLFVQMARPEHLRALGIDKAMERVVSPERPRDENGAPVLSPEHPISPLEMLGYFLKVE